MIKGLLFFFEKENIDTMDTKGEVLLTILSSLAQDESRNISENCKWGIIRQFQSGKVLVNTARFLGYDKDENGELVINNEEAKIVKRIFNEYLEGKSYQAIANGLMRDGIKTGTGNSKWWDSTISGILTNEKYHGDVLLQKTYTVDFLNHKRIKNNGIAQQFYIEQNHEPIISRDLYDRVQDEKERRALLKGNLVGNRHKYSSKYAFSSKVFCGKCGNIFKRRTWNSNKSKYKKAVWQCKTYVVDGRGACDAKAVDEQVLMDAFVRVFNRINENKDGFIKTLKDNIEKVLAETASNQLIEELESKIEVLKDDLKGLVKLQVRNSIDDAVYNEEYIRISSELDELREQRAEFDRQNNIRNDYRERLNVIIETLNGWQGLLVEFSDEIFNALVEKIEVISPTHFVFILKSGMRVEEHI
ncbi:recombinase family protein [Desulfofarcimen acetoxidans]|uniref:recombinase family protein n=1 Tax=Desulfofarcimen acetoxidans TaxID=58138 RepID=UPI00019E52B5|nr:recombinase family protein [Desulfofarcimen acetoxidans]